MYTTGDVGVVKKKGGGQDQGLEEKDGGRKADEQRRQRLECDGGRMDGVSIGAVEETSGGLSNEGDGVWES